MEKKLKPCPFCGSAYINDTEFAIQDEDGQIRQYLCVCPDCAVAQAPQDTSEEAVKEWNARPREEALDVTIKKMLDALIYAEEFIDQHSEPWYTTGQLLLAKVRSAIASGKPNDHL